MYKRTAVIGTIHDHLLTRQAAWSCPTFKLLNPQLQKCETHPTIGFPRSLDWLQLSPDPFWLYRVPFFPSINITGEEVNHDSNTIWNGV